MDFFWNSFRYSTLQKFVGGIPSRIISGLRAGIPPKGILTGIL